MSLAWAAFSVKNGAESEGAMRDRAEKYRRRFDKHTGPGEDNRIGCILLAEPTFFPMASWVREPRDWSPNIVQGRTLDLSRYAADMLKHDRVISLAEQRA